MESQFTDLSRPLSSARRGRGGKGLVVFPGALGDFLCFLPALRCISARERDSELEIAMRSDFADLLSHRTPSISVRSLDCHVIGRLFAGGGTVDEGLKSLLAGYGFIYSWMGSQQPDFVRNLASHYEGDLRVYPFRPPESNMPMPRYYLSCLGETAVEPAQGITPSAAAVAWSRGLWRQGGLEGKRILALAPGSGAKEKNWPASHFHFVSSWWRKRTQGKVLVIVGPAEEDRAEEDRMEGEWRWGGDLTVKGVGLAQLAAMLSRCDVYLGNDSGISHLAAAVGAVTLAIFGPTDPVQWGPFGPRVTVVREELECSPCDHLTMKGCPHRSCLNGLHPAKLIRLLEDALLDSLLDKGRAGIYS